MPTPVKQDHVVAQVNSGHLKFLVTYGTREECAWSADRKEAMVVTKDKAEIIAGKINTMFLFKYHIARPLDVRKEHRKTYGTLKMSKPKIKVQLSHAKMIATNRITRRSTQKSPVALAWGIYNAHPKLQRKDAINLAISNGIAFYTARTQYQAWRMAGKNDEEAARKSKILMARMGLK